MGAETKSFVCNNERWKRKIRKIPVLSKRSIYRPSHATISTKRFFLTSVHLSLASHISPFRTCFFMWLLSEDRCLNFISQRTTCIKQGFWPILEPRTKSYFSPPSLVCFTRLMTKVLIFHFDLTLTVAMVTENGHQYWLKYRKSHLRFYTRCF